MWHTGLVVLQHVGSSWIRDGASVPCIARWTLNHWTTQEALEYIFNMEFTEASNESLVECEGYRGVNDAPKALFLRKELPSNDWGRLRKNIFFKRGRYLELNF